MPVPTGKTSQFFANSESGDLIGRHTVYH